MFSIDNRIKTIYVQNFKNVVKILNEVDMHRLVN